MLAAGDAHAFAHPSPEVQCFRATLARIRYRDGWALYAWDHPDRTDRVRMQARWNTTDSDDPARTIRHSLTLGVDRERVQGDDADHVMLAWWLIEQVEAHERREFFTFDGRCIFDPHADIDAARAQRPEAVHG